MKDEKVDYLHPSSFIFHPSSFRKVMRILAIVPSIYDTNPSQRYRIEQWEPLLRERGVEITYKPFESEALHAVLYKQGHVGEKLRHAAEALVRRAGDVRGARGFDAVYVLREAALLGPAFFERWLSLAGRPSLLLLAGAG